MNKTKSDQLMGSLPALEIVSTLQISPEGSYISAVSSETCGLGWTFDLRVVRNEQDGSRIGQLFITFDADFLGQTTYQIESVQCGFRDINKPMRTWVGQPAPLLGSSVYIGDIAQYDNLFGATLTCIVIVCPHSNKPVAERISAITLDSMDGQQFVDTKVYAYTRRSTDGSAVNPRSFFIQSTIIAQYGCEPLSLLFGKAEGFHSEDALLDLHRLPESQQSLAEPADYQDDSDFEDDDEVDVPGIPSDGSNAAQERLSTPVDRSKASKDSAGETSYADSSTPHDTTLPHVVVPHPEDLESYVDSQVLLTWRSYSFTTSVMRSQNALRYGRIKVLSNGAYRTWRGIIRYIYTGKIEFAPLRSTKRPRPSPQACSPKSVYRIADEYGMEALKELAFMELASNITVDNVLEEIFGYFAFMYPEVCALCKIVILRERNNPQLQSGMLEMEMNHNGITQEKDHERRNCSATDTKNIIIN
ncbi:hypothetical protein CYLTODRAFT_447249 [Cylindrobasidium torrendii FP15055 ss-10]|uniref:BTB domain-containing protein n=1 Tax=Cylindrobasidium torrendii FP15055 ss-10 TaxID=1314674 RepID=A0A0D7AWJ4_9AGAR|nr:hypothetical protein CYLTODRAFT_447249 [Cylindrobasidium torrendii FP15055 ss-10]